MTIKVIEGDPEHPVDHEDNVVLKEWDVDITPPRPVSEAGFTVTYSYDVDGIQFDRVRYPSTSFGYDPVTSAAYQAWSGQPPPTAPSMGGGGITNFSGVSVTVRQAVA